MNERAQPQRRDHDLDDNNDDYDDDDDDGCSSRLKV
jgi:hypothetical protein